MRLIDADALKEYCKEGLVDVLPRFKTDKYKDLAIRVTGDFCRDIDEQPTVQAVPIPENATNGGVMMLVFDSRYKDEYTSFVHLEVGNGYFIPIPKGWWNASYEGSDTE